jgi:hypothetical protein
MVPNFDFWPHPSNRLALNTRTHCSTNIQNANQVSLPCRDLAVQQESHDLRAMLHLKVPECQKKLNHTINRRECRNFVKYQEGSEVVAETVPDLTDMA